MHRNCLLCHQIGKNTNTGIPEGQGDVSKITITPVFGNSGVIININNSISFEFRVIIAHHSFVLET